MDYMAAASMPVVLAHPVLVAAPGQQQPYPGFVIPAHVVADGAKLKTDGIFDCFADTTLCCVGLLCPCVVFGRNVADLGLASSRWGATLAFAAAMAVLAALTVLPEILQLAHARARFDQALSECRAEPGGECRGTALPSAVWGCDVPEDACEVRRLVVLLVLVLVLVLQLLLVLLLVLTLSLSVPARPGDGGVPRAVANVGAHELGGRGGAAGDGLAAGGAGAGLPAHEGGRVAGRRDEHPGGQLPGAWCWCCWCCWCWLCWCWLCWCWLCWLCWCWRRCWWCSCGSCCRSYGSCCRCCCSSCGCCYC